MAFSILLPVQFSSPSSAFTHPHTTFPINRPLPRLTRRPRSRTHHTHPSTPSPAPFLNMSTAPPPDHPNHSLPPGGVLYFSYGSNMSREKLRNRGSDATPPIAFTSAQPARLADWSLSFNMRGAPPVEPAMGSIKPEPSSEVFGIAYRIEDEPSWQKLMITEGISSTPATDSYHVVDVNVECFEPDTPQVRVTRSAKTLKSNPRVTLEPSLEPYVRPSRRYVDLLIGGAESEGLPEPYIRQLKEIVVARRWTVSPLFAVMTIAIPALFIVRKMQMTFLTYPLRTYGVILYAQHERIMFCQKLRPVQRMQLWALRCLLFLLYALYVPPVMVLVLLHPKSRAYYMTIVKMFKAQQPKNGTEGDKLSEDQKAEVAKLANQAIGAMPQTSK